MSEKHYLFGGSGAHRWMKCARSIIDAEGLPEQESNVHAVEGTVAHTFAADVLLGKTTLEELENWEGEVVDTDEGFKIKVTQQMIDGVRLYVEEVWETMRGCKGLLHVEVQTPIKGIDEEDCGGTPDAVIESSDRTRRIFLYDFKFGRGFVDAKENEQGLLYLCRFVEELGLDNLENYVFEFIIVQPKLANPIRRWTVTGARLKQFYMEARMQVAQTQMERAKPASERTAPYVPGDWCKYCPVGDAGRCAKNVGDAMETAAEAIAAFEPIVDSGTADVPLQTLLEYLDLEEKIHRAFGIMKAYVRSLLENGIAVPGWELIDTFKKPTWVDEAEVIAHFEDLLGDDMFSKSLLTPAKMRKAVARARKASGIKGTLKVLEEGAKEEIETLTDQEKKDGQRMVRTDGHTNEFESIEEEN